MLDDEHARSELPADADEEWPEGLGLSSGDAGRRLVEAEHGSTDGRWKYARAPEGDGYPLAMWSNRWSTMPVHGLGMSLLPAPDHRATLETMPGSTVPVLRQPFVSGDMLPMFAASQRIVGRHHVYDLDVDPGELENRRGESCEGEAIELLNEALHAVSAPAEQFARLGLSSASGRS